MDAAIALDGSTFTCPTGLQGPSLVAVNALPQSYCIDQTEVTGAQYAAFIAANVPTSGQPSACSWNSSYVPCGTLASNDLPRSRWVLPRSPARCRSASAATRGSST